MILKDCKTQAIPHSPTAYDHDAFGRRVMAQQSGHATQYWLYGANGGDQPVAENNGAWQTDIQVEGATVATVDSANNVTYLAVSMLKTTKMTVSGAGSASGVATYYPYGQENASISAEYKFTNQIRDPNGIDHFWMRSYAPALGRWLTPDPAGLAAVDPTNPQSWNRYAYVLNNPAAAIDPLGLSTHACGGSTSGGINFCTDVNGNNPPGDGLANAAQLALDQSALGGIGSPYDGIAAPSHYAMSGAEINAGAMAVAQLANAALKAVQCPISPGQMDRYLGHKHSPLTGEGADLFTMGYKYNVDPRLVIAISGAESTFGRSTNATWGYYNAWGWSGPGHASWTNWSQGIEAVTGGLGGYRYLGGGKTTTADIYNGTYCDPNDPRSNCAGGLRTIDAVLKEQAGNPSALTFPCPRGGRS